MSYEYMLLERDSRVGVLTLNRPDKLNAFVGTMRDELGAAFAELDDDPDVKVIVITGAGRAFCAGADVRYMHELSGKNDVMGLSALVEAGGRVVQRMRASGKPVIGMINGIAAGGGANLALACDLRFASDTAGLAQSFNKIGLMPDWGGTYFLPRLVGPSKALDLMWGAEVANAATCEKLGLFNRVVPAAALREVTMAFARELATKPATSLALTKRAVYDTMDRSLAEMLKVELDGQIRCFQQGDAREGIAAFVEKRAPVFGG